METEPRPIRRSAKRRTRSPTYDEDLPRKRSRAEASDEGSVPPRPSIAVNLDAEQLLRKIRGIVRSELARALEEFTLVNRFDGIWSNTEVASSAAEYGMRREYGVVWDDVKEAWKPLPRYAAVPGPSSGRRSVAEIMEMERAKEALRKRLAAEREDAERTQETLQEDKEESGSSEEEEEDEVPMGKGKGRARG